MTAEELTQKIIDEAEDDFGLLPDKYDKIKPGIIKALKAKDKEIRFARNLLTIGLGGVSKCDNCSTCQNYAKRVMTYGIEN